VLAFHSTSPHMPPSVDEPAEAAFIGLLFLLAYLCHDLLMTRMDRHTLIVGLLSMLLVLVAIVAVAARLS